MARPSLEIADIFRNQGGAWRAANAGHVSRDQVGVMRAVERCWTAALGGQVARCEDCAHEHIAYNSCRNRHCPKYQASAARDWLAAREAELLPVGYFHVVFRRHRRTHGAARGNDTGYLPSDHELTNPQARRLREWLRGRWVDEWLLRGDASRSNLPLG
jgi:hypothetical protein